MWNSVQVSVGAAVLRGRYRMEGDQMVLETRNGRVAARCGLLKPEVVAIQFLRQQANTNPMAA